MIRRCVPKPMKWFENGVGFRKFGTDIEIVWATNKKRFGYEKEIFDIQRG